MVAPVRIAAEREVVDRGDSVGFRVEALGRRTATLWLRAPGEPWHPVGVRLDSVGHAVVSSGPLDERRLRPGDQRYAGVPTRCW